MILHTSCGTRTSESTQNPSFGYPTSDEGVFFVIFDEFSKSSASQVYFSMKNHQIRPKVDNEWRSTYLVAY